MNAVVLGAGFSRRFGSTKQLFEFDGEPLIRRAARIAAEVAETIVVRAALSDLDVVVVENAEADEGMASSIRAGVAVTVGDILLLVCDQPGVTPVHWHALTNTGAPLAAFGVPAFFAADFRGELLSLRGDTGARGVLNAHRDQLAIVPLAWAEDWDVPPSRLR